MSKKKKIIWSIILIICVLLVCKFFVIGRSFNELLLTNQNNITRVFMRKGKDGSSVATTDKAKIGQLINILNNKTYKISLKQSQRVGYSYFYDFYKGSRKVLSITGDGSNININGICYGVSKPVSVDNIQDWFDSLPVTKWPDSAK